MAPEAQSAAAAAPSGLGQANDSRMKKLVLVGPHGQLVCDICHVADRPHTRVRGVIGWRTLRRGEGMLIRPSFSIHTAFVRFPIDAVFLDRGMKVLAIRHNMKPWRLAGARRAYAVLELAEGEAERLGIRTGDYLGWGAL
jgi:uncharacterized membrane protein (UPF0127 family)